MDEKMKIIVRIISGPAEVLAPPKGLSLTTIHTDALLPSSSSPTATSSQLSAATTSSTAHARMATPSSSATSPSPPMPYLHPGPPSQQASASSQADPVDQEQRKKAVNKFLARAEVAMVTRALRARLAYASYKATHNIPHIPLRDLEAQSQSQTASFNRTIAAKRKAVGATGSYSSQPTSSNSAGAGNLRRGGSGTMAPPATVSSPRSHHTSVNGGPAYPTYNDAARNTSQAPSLYTSILAPLRLNRRGLYITLMTRLSQLPDASRSQAKGKQTSKAGKAPASPSRRRTAGGSIDKGKRKQRSDNMAVDADGDIDMKAAAALTSLLMHNRPSIAGSASSPRSSIDGSEVGSVYSYSQFTQSSARASNTSAPAPLSAAPSSSNLLPEPGIRMQTPPPGPPKQHTTPRAAPTDSEAANLMLFLATSPSPVRPGNKESRDMAAFRALGGGSGPLRSKGRVLFPPTSTADPSTPGQEDSPAPSGSTSHKPTSALARSGDASFTSSISSIGAELGGGSQAGANEDPSSQIISIASGSGSAASSTGPAVSQLLPPAPLPLTLAPTSPAGRRGTPPNPRPNLVGVPGGNGNAGPLDFGFNEFINASPSSPRSAHAHAYGVSTNPKPNLGLRADVGRKLFEEEQMRHAQALQAAAAAAAVGNTGQRQEERPLGAGIDLIHS
ncbi:hypothetical protein CPB84DRAFT_1842591 [Gymnopilus junonius]|uniref:Uncharacterized protein n=1 Tax=Gymnopilus junonius TaxID=109634 RepID=A0A9P5NVI9_GYMJU|nr:hypothetical protein CPB84DRAFT_1842591 [Gymnopilus junonius]